MIVRLLLIAEFVTFPDLTYVDPLMCTFVQPPPWSGCRTFPDHKLSHVLAPYSDAHPHQPKTLANANLFSI